MDDSFDNIPVPYRTERLGRIRDLITQIRADYSRYEAIRQKIEDGIGTESDTEEMQKNAAWLRRDLLIYRRLNSVSIEGITCGELSSTSHLFSIRK